MSKPIKSNTADDIDDEKNDEREHPAVDEWLDDENDKPFQRMKPPPRRMGRSSRDD